MLQSGLHVEVERRTGLESRPAAFLRSSSMRAAQLPAARPPCRVGRITATASFGTRSHNFSLKFGVPLLSKGGGKRADRGEGEVAGGRTVEKTMMHSAANYGGRPRMPKLKVPSGGGTGVSASARNWKASPARFGPEVDDLVPERSSGAFTERARRPLRLDMAGSDVERESSMMSNRSATRGGGN